MSNNEFHARGIINKVLAASEGVFIFVLKTEERHPIYIKVKLFRNKEIPVEEFTAQCNNLLEGDRVAVAGRLGTEKVVKGNGEPVQTKEGHDVYAPVISATFIDKLAVTVSVFAPSAPASAPANQGQVSAPAPTPAANTPPAPSIQQHAPVDEEGLPETPFQPM